MVKSDVIAKCVENENGEVDIVVDLSADGKKIYKSIFVDPGAAAALVEKINRMGVSPLHIDDVIEDALP